ncbi:hypothetical protein ACIPRI_08690 [Variovorax sp. LARHSF232]
MAIVVLWAEADHQKRAELLAKTYGAQAINIAGGAAPATVADLDTLVFWGHGDAQHFCSLDDSGFLDVVSDWKKQNKKISSVEMISCNLRHRQGTYTDSYTMKVVAKLKKKHAGLTFKALPVATTRMGVTCENSILKWQPASQTWAYCATPGKEDKYMWAVCKMLEDQMPPRGDKDGYARAHNALAATNFMDTHKFGKDQYGSVVMEDCSARHMLCVSNNAYVGTGTVGTLRWSLAEIK